VASDLDADHPSPRLPIESGDAGSESVDESVKGGRSMADILIALVMAILSVLFGTGSGSIAFETCVSNHRVIIQETSLSEDQAADVFYPSALIAYVPTATGRSVIVLRSPVDCEVE
jgi:hypothetical protein